MLKEGLVFAGILRIMLVVWLALLLSPVAFYFLVFTSKPTVMPGAALDTRELYRVQRSIQSQQAQVAADGLTTIALNQQDLNTALNFAIASYRLPLVNGIAVELEEQQLLLRTTVELPLKIERRFIALEVLSRPSEQGPEIENIKFGLLPIPGSWLEVPHALLANYLAGDEGLQSISTTWEAIESLAVDDQTFTLRYRHSPEIQQSIQARQSASFWQRVDTDAVEVYIKHLRPIAGNNEGRRRSLLTLLQPAYALAANRTNNNGDPISENMAALVAVAMYAADPRVLELSKLDDQFGYPDVRPRLSLHRRDDLSKHFISSAIISLYAGEEIADMLGMQKEIDDIDRRSGFDLSDLVADKAGIRFADFATASNDSALALQRRLAELDSDAALLPSPRDLPHRQVSQSLVQLKDEQLANYLVKLDGEASEWVAAIALYQLL